MVIMQEPTQSLAALHWPLTTNFCVPREQQDIVLPLVISLSVEMLDIFDQRPSQRALTEENHLGQALLLHRPDPALRRCSIGLPAPAAACPPPRAWRAAAFVRRWRAAPRWYSAHAADRRTDGCRLPPRDWPWRSRRGAPPGAILTSLRRCAVLPAGRSWRLAVWTTALAYLIVLMGFIVRRRCIWPFDFDVRRGGQNRTGPVEILRDDGRADISPGGTLCCPF